MMVDSGACCDSTRAVSMITAVRRRHRRAGRIAHAVGHDRAPRVHVAVITYTRSGVSETADGRHHVGDVDALGREDRAGDERLVIGLQRDGHPATRIGA